MNTTDIEDWKSEAYRQRVRLRLDKVLEQLRAPSHYNSFDLEEKIFELTIGNGATKQIYHGQLKRVMKQIQTMRK